MVGSSGWGRPFYMKECLDVECPQGRGSGAGQGHKLRYLLKLP